MDETQIIINSFKEKSVRNLNFKEFENSITNFEEQVKENVKVPESDTHIMISYSWSHQDYVLNIAHRLQEMGFKIWIDIQQHSTGTLLEKIALAIEESSIVLVCVSREYQMSQACRTEAEYTYILKKPFIPLILDDSKPSSWLGALLGTQIFVNFSNHETFEDNIQELTKLIEKKGISSSNSNTVFSTKKPIDETWIGCMKWTQKEVEEWLEKNELDGLKEKFRTQNINGKVLEELAKLIKYESNELFIWELMKDIPIESVGERILLRKALIQLSFFL